MNKNKSHDEFMKKLEFDCLAGESIFDECKLLAQNRYEVSHDGGSEVRFRRDLALGLYTSLFVDAVESRAIALVTFPILADNPMLPKDIAKFALVLDGINWCLRNKGYVGTYKSHDDGVEFEYEIPIASRSDLEKILSDFNI